MRFALFLLVCGVLTGLPAAESVPSGSSTILKCKPGPWGDLEYYHIQLEAPDHIVDLVAAPSERTSWFFPGKSIEEIKAILTTALITGEAQEELITTATRYQSRPPYRLFPSLEVVESMNPVSRQILYRELRPWSENRFFHRPIIIETGDVKSWFADSGLSPETIARIENLTYRIGDALAFSDVSAILAKIFTDYEEREFLKALTRTRSLVLRLIVSPGSDLETVKDYWSMEGFSPAMLPFFESMAKTTRVERIDAIHLLPPTPRKHLNTFPSLSLGIEGQFPGSFWTSMNFLRHNPLIEFDDPEYAKAYARQYFEKATPPFEYGDLMVMTDPVSGRTSHTCIFIADDIVYTKNGRSILRPFVLMHLEDMLARYSTTARPGIEVWRNKR